MDGSSSVAFTSQKPLRVNDDTQHTYAICQSSLLDQLEEPQAQANDHSRDSATPQELPAELLVYIFQYHVDMNGSPWALTCVNRAWKRAAEMTHAAWKTISLRAIPEDKASWGKKLHCWKVDGLKRYSMGKAVVCTSVEELALIINRTGSLPLDICIAYLQCHEAPTKVALQDPKITSRIASLEIHGGKGHVRDLGITSVGPFPRLETLVIERMQPQVPELILANISLSQPRLESLTIHDVALSASKQYTFWRTLKVLDLDRRVPLALFEQAIPHLVHAKTLANCPRFWPNGNTPVGTQFLITSLEVTCSGKHLLRLDLPELKTLSISDIEEDQGTGGNANNQPHSIFLPKLVDLVIRSDDPAPWLQGFEAPRLRSFKHLVSRNTQTPFRGVYFPAVVEIVLGSVSTDAFAISALKSAPNVRRVALHLGAKAPSTWGRGVLKYLADSEGIACPKMVSLQLGTSYRGLRMVETSAKPFIQKILRRRPESGLKITVFWSQSGKTVEMREYS